MKVTYRTETFFVMERILSDGSVAYDVGTTADDGESIATLIQVDADQSSAENRCRALQKALNGY